MAESEVLLPATQSFQHPLHTSDILRDMRQSHRGLYILDVLGRLSREQYCEIQREKLIDMLKYVIWNSAKSERVSSKKHSNDLCTCKCGQFKHRLTDWILIAGNTEHILICIVWLRIVITLPVIAIIYHFVKICQKYTICL